MKRPLLTSILGIAISATVACGQGFVALDNYNSSVSPLITYGGLGGPLGQPITGGQWTVGLYFGEGDFVSAVPQDPTGYAVPSTLHPLFALATGVGSTAPLVSPGVFISSGSFRATTAAIPGPVTFMVVVYYGADYVTSTLRSHSTAFTMTPKVGTEFPPFIGDYMPTFSIFIPEPSTFALTGMSVAALLIARRFKLV